MFHLFDISTLLLAAAGTAPVWLMVILPFLVIAIIILMRKELWTLLIRIETGFILLLIIAALSLIGGLLPQFFTDDKAAEKLVGVTIPDVAEPDYAARVLELPIPSEVSAEMAAGLMNLPTPAAVTMDEAVELMGVEPGEGVSLQDAFSGWLKREYVKTIIAKYHIKFQELLADGGKLYVTFYKLGFFWIYHTWYYLTLASLLFLNTLLCTYVRLTAYLKRKKFGVAGFTAERLMMENQVVESMLDPGKADNADDVGKILKENRFHPIIARKLGDGFQFRLDFGFNLPHTITSIVFHWGIFLMFFGFIASSFLTWKGMVYLNVGEIKEVNIFKPDMKLYKWYEGLYAKRGWGWANPEKRFDMEASFEIRCNDYVTEYEPTEEGWYSTKDYKSDLSILKDGQEVKNRIIEVNFPLIYRGVYFYQTDIIQSGTLAITGPGGYATEVQAGPWQTEMPELPGVTDILTATALVVGKLFEPDGTVKELSPRLRIGRYIPAKKEDWPNPGEEETEKPKMRSRMWEVDWVTTVEDGRQSEWNGYTFELKGPYPKGTGLQTRRDPGVPILWFAFIVLMVTMTLRVYFPQYTARVDVTPTAEGTQVIVAGKARGLSANFKKQAERIISLLKSGNEE